MHTNPHHSPAPSFVPLRRHERVCIWWFCTHKHLNANISCTNIRNWGAPTSLLCNLKRFCINILWIVVVLASVHELKLTIAAKRFRQMQLIQNLCPASARPSSSKFHHVGNEIEWIHNWLCVQLPEQPYLINLRFAAAHMYNTCSCLVHV